VIKSRLHILMGEKKIKSINQLSNETGISRLTLTNIYNESGKAIEYETMHKLCDYFNCTVGDLLVYEKDKRE
jgi:putative transcriptional regulator